MLVVFKQISFSDVRYSVCIVSVFRLALVHIATIHHNFSRRLLITNTRIESWLIKRLGSGVAAVLWSAVEAT